MEMVIGRFWRVDSLEGFREESFRRWKLVLERNIGIRLE